MNRKNEWIEYVKTDVICTAFGYARYCKSMENIKGFNTKNSLTLPSLGWTYFKTSGDESDEPIYTIKDKYMRWFVRHSIKGGRCTAFNQNYKSKSAENAFGATSGQLKVKGNVFEVSEV